MKDSPCVNCPLYEDCGGAMCKDWRDWFHEIWSNLRRNYLGIEEVTDGK